MSGLPVPLPNARIIAVARRNGQIRIASLSRRARMEWQIKNMDEPREPLPIGLSGLLAQDDTARMFVLIAKSQPAISAPPRHLYIALPA